MTEPSKVDRKDSRTAQHLEPARVLRSVTRRDQNWALKMAQLMAPWKARKTALQLEGSMEECLGPERAH